MEIMWKYCGNIENMLLKYSGLAILSTENEHAKRMDIDKLVNISAEEKGRRKNF